MPWELFGMKHIVYICIICIYIYIYIYIYISSCPPGWSRHRAGWLVECLIGWVVEWLSRPGESTKNRSTNDCSQQPTSQQIDSTSNQQCNKSWPKFDSTCIKNPPSWIPKPFKISPWSSLGRSWKGLGDILAPRGTKTPKRGTKSDSFGPPDPQDGTKIHQNLSQE